MRFRRKKARQPDTRADNPHGDKRLKAIQIDGTLVFDGKYVRDRNEWDVIIGRRPMIPDELTLYLWETETPLDEDKREENRVWLNKLFSNMDVGRGWLWPVPFTKNVSHPVETPRYFKKITEHHFQERDIAQTVLKALDGKWSELHHALKRGDWEKVSKIVSEANLPASSFKNDDELNVISFDIEEPVIDEEQISP